MASAGAAAPRASAADVAIAVGGGDDDKRGSGGGGGGGGACVHAKNPVAHDAHETMSSPCGCASSGLPSGGAPTGVAAPDRAVAGGASHDDGATLLADPSPNRFALPGALGSLGASTSLPEACAGASFLSEAVALRRGGEPSGPPPPSGAAASASPGLW